MEQRQFFLRDILTVVFKHKRLLIVFPAIVLIFVTILSYIWPPTYESEAKIRMMRGREVFQPDLTMTQSPGSVAMVQMGVEEINSALEQFYSKDLLRLVVTDPDLDLANNSKFPYGEGLFVSPFKAIRGIGNTLLYILQLRERPDDDTILAMEQLEKRLLTEPVRDSHVINVAVRVGDRELAQQILDAVLREYELLHIRMFNRETNHFFGEQKDRIETELRKAQNELQEYQKNNNISLLETEKELLLEQFTNSRRILAQLAQTKDAIARTMDVEDFDSSVISTLSGETDSTVVREMQLRLLELVLEYSRVTQSLGKRHPAVASLEEQIRSAQSNLLKAIDSVEDAETTKVSVIQARLDDLNDTRAQLQKLEQDVDINSARYAYYSEKFEESLISDMLAAERYTNVRVASSPTMPSDPVFPNKLANMILAIIGGIIAALALAFFLDYLDHGLKTPEDVEYYCRIQPLASFFNSGGQPIRGPDAERLAVLIDTFQEGKESHVVQVTSSVPGEGGSLVADALATAFANDPEARTLLIDLAGEIPRARNSAHGISDVLLEQASFEEVFPDNESLTIIGRGSHGEYPTYLWSSDRMKELMERIRGKYRHIILNTAPVLSAHDPVKLVRHVDGVLLVIRSSSTRREVVNRALSMLGESKSKVIGAVMTERKQEIPQSVYRRI